MKKTKLKTVRVKDFITKDWASSSSFGAQIRNYLSKINKSLFFFCSCYLHPFAKYTLYPLSTSQLPIISFLLKKYTPFQKCIFRIKYTYFRNIYLEL